MFELTVHEYVSRAVAIPVPVSVTAILLIAAVPVVVTIVPVEVMTGAIVSIRFTFAVALPVFPARSSKVKMNDPLSVKRYDQAFIFVNVSLNPVSIAKTFPLVRFPIVGV
jgi:CRISPR/Cas system-associated endonuclease Cas3-HD